VLWLASDADARLRALIGLVAASFPDHPPYGGVFADVVPHLTIADRAPVDAMRAAEQRLQAHLPISVMTREVTLLVGSESGRWHAAASFALGG
jgi:hypothetical protein